MLDGGNAGFDGFSRNCSPRSTLCHRSISRPTGPTGPTGSSRGGRHRHCGRGKSTPPGAVIGAVVKSAMLEAIACSVRKLMRQEAWPLVWKRPSLLQKDMNSSLLHALVTNRALNKAQRAG